MGFFCDIIPGMVSLAQTGTSELLEQLSPFINDDLISELMPSPSRPGRPRSFSSAQLFRVLLLALLTPVHSFNLLTVLLPENRQWRRFAHLHNRRDIPTPKMLHQFRERLPLGTLRSINSHLVRPLIEKLDPNRLTVAIMDSTDLPAAVNEFKKNFRLHGHACCSGRQNPQDRPEQMVHWL